MTRYIVQRLIVIIPIIIFMSLVQFALWNLAPGDPVSAMIPPEMQAELSLRAEDMQKLRESYGLNEPIYVRYLIWLREVAAGNFGYSTIYYLPVTKLVLERIPATLRLTGMAFLLSLILGISLGVISAIKQYSWLDHLLTFLVFVWMSVPGFFVALSFVFIFSIVLGLFPSLGMLTPGMKAGTWSSLWDNIHHLILPALALGLAGIGGILRYTRNSLLDVLGQEYMRTARAKGLSERVVLVRHGLGNALLPVVTILGLTLPGLLGGSLLIEYVFSWPGMGTLGLAAIRMRDYNMMQLTLVFFGGLTLLANLITDIAYAYVDPRIRYD